METINEQLKNSFYQHPEIIKQLETVKKQVVQHEITPFVGAKYLLDLFKK
jgi:LAO/AO transport system kinase